MATCDGPATDRDELIGARAKIERLRAALEPFGEIARRLGWDDAMPDAEKDAHIIEAPADEISPGAVYCLHVSTFIEARRAIEQP